MDWTAAVDIYCERVGPGFWAEPINAVSNAAFLIAAVAAYGEWRRRAAGDRWLLIMIALVAVIGSGSFLFHTFANRWSGITDVLPIVVFIYSMFALVFRRFVGLGWIGTAVGLAVFFGANVLLVRLLGPLVGASAGYLPALLAMVIVGAYLARQHHPFAGWTLTAAAVFAISLTFRMLDQPICDTFPYGTHYLWHALNAVTLWCLLAGAIRTQTMR